MNSEETLALWRQGKEAWGRWSRGVLEKRRALEKAGKWSVDWYGEGQNEETKAWLEEATANFAGATFDADANFGGLHFPGPADFDDARFAGAANFAGAEFGGNVTFQAAEFAAVSLADAKFRGFANFDKARFAGEAGFAKAQFLKASDLEPCARFHRAQFLKPAVFTGAQFAGGVQFVKASFTGVQFDACTFEGDTLFKSAQFDVSASFVKARFSGARVDFREAQFRGDTRFLEAHFGGSWAGLVISGACSVSFEAARFERETSFRQAWFIGESDFRNAQFKGVVRFDSALFVMPARFAPAVFSTSTSFAGAQFVHEADFSAARFLEDSDFSAAKFGSEALFRQVRFAGPAKFAGAEFGGRASFYGVSAEAAFTLDGARATALPETGDANFAQNPAFDKLVIFTPRKPRFPWLGGRRGAGRSLFARWMKAAPGSGLPEDHPPEFLSAEDESAPAATGTGEPAVSLRTTAAAKIAPAAATAGPEGQTEEKAVAPASTEEAASSPKNAAPAGRERRFRILRFGPGQGSAPAAPQAVAASTASAGGARRRSMARPFFVWLAGIAAFTPFYLQQRPLSHAGDAAAPLLPDWPSWLTWNGAPAWLHTHASAAWDSLSRLSASAAGLFSSGPCVHGGSQPVEEALFLSAKNALVFVPWENEHVIRRVYGCLYGLEGAEPVIPVAVSLASLMQAALSAVLFAMIFIALRERLKRK